jgi:hypothetical protein
MSGEHAARTCSVAEPGREASDREADVEDVAFLDDVVLPFHAELPGGLGSV